MVDNNYFNEWKSKNEIDNLIKYINRKIIEYKYRINLKEEYNRLNKEKQNGKIIEI